MAVSDVALDVASGSAAEQLTLAMERFIGLASGTLLDDAACATDRVTTTGDAATSVGDISSSTGVANSSTGAATGSPSSQAGDSAPTTTVDDSGTPAPATSAAAASPAPTTGSGASSPGLHHASLLLVVALCSLLCC